MMLIEFLPEEKGALSHIRAKGISPSQTLKMGLLGLPCCEVWDGPGGGIGEDLDGFLAWGRGIGRSGRTALEEEASLNRRRGSWSG